MALSVNTPDLRSQVRHVVTVAARDDANWPDGEAEPYYAVTQPQHVTALALMARPIHLSDLDTHAFRSVDEFVAELNLDPSATVWVLPYHRLAHIANHWQLKHL